MKHITIKGLLKKYDAQKKKITLLFMSDEIDSFTRQFLNGHYNKSQINPMRNGEFYVKYNNNSRFYLDKAEQNIATSMDSLLERVVNMTIYIRHYDFIDKKGKRIIGWNITLVKLFPEF